MNFTDLLAKMKSIDESGEMTPPVQAPELPQDPESFLVGEKSMEEGGGEVQISMTMQDLLALMGKMEQGHSHGDEVVVGMEEAGEDGGFGDATTEPNATVSDMSAVTPTGDDLASKGAEAEKVNGGGNPFNVDESLVARLAQMYDEIKEAKEEKFDALKHVKNPTKGEKEAAKDVKRGSYADRAAMLKSAEADGRLKEAAKWRDPKHKDKLYTQEPRDENDYGSDDDYYNPKPDDYPGAKNLKGGGEYDHNDPLRKGYGRHGTGSPLEKGPRKGLPSRNHITSLKGSIKGAHGSHPAPKLPK